LTVIGFCFDAKGTNNRVLEKHLEDFGLWTFDKVAVLFENKFYFTVGDGAVADKVDDGGGEWDLGKAT